MPDALGNGIVLMELLVEGMTPAWWAIHPRACEERFGSLARSSAPASA
jgi:hypothetical protein